MAVSADKQQKPFAVLAGAVFNKKNTPYFLLLPAFIYYAVFWVAPILAGVKEVFTDYNGAFDPLFSIKLILQNDPLFGSAFVNTVIFAAVSVVIQYFVALMLAVLLNKRFPGSRFMMFMTMIPMAVPPTVVAILWKTGLIDTGWINHVAMSFHILREPVTFLSARGFDGVLLLILIDTWTVMPSVMIILIAGLQNMQKEYSEAAYIFGANRWRILIDVTLPLLKPSIITSVILRMIAAVQVWSIAVMVMGFNAVPFLVERVAFFQQIGYGYEYARKLTYTYSLITTALVLLATFIYFSAAKKKTAFDGATQK
ncbi:MAG: sugar ABC transporter permease [Spirochaetaceae bacterium]|jgi:multiple sugar transport system permease protein|nr:sugar ABC transporter permease [Spirochaetaceae bacterium]